MGTLKITKNYLTNNLCYQRGVTCEKIGIQIHTIGMCTGDSTESVARLLEPGYNPGMRSLHLRCGCCLAMYCSSFQKRLRSWADAGWGNNNLISIEICESDYISNTTAGQVMTVDDEAKFKADIMRGYNTAIHTLCEDLQGAWLGSACGSQ